LVWSSHFHAHRRIASPRGSILSVTVFAIAINIIKSRVHRLIMCSLYVEFAMYYRFRSLPAIEGQLLLAMNWLSLWSQENSFKFLIVKTICIHFCQVRGVFPHLNLFMDNSPLTYAETVRLLGLILDNHLTWELHIWQLRTKYQ
jgi:hypothetical protein